MDTLYTQRLILRPLARSDARDLFGARCDTEVMEFWDALPDATYSETIAIVDLLLAEVLSGAAKYWTILLQSDGSFVGICDLSEIRSGESADLGFMLLRKHWGAGFGSEVVSCLLEFAKSFGLRLVTARIHAGNVRSRRLLLPAGFQLVQVIRNCEIRPGAFRDCLRFEATL
jgi:[ribosomal protein S5]-alanine N-acetyltransferase